VLVTRTRQQASQLSQALRELGARVLEGATIAVQDGDRQAVDQAITNMHAYDWLVLTSANGVAALAQRLEAMGLDARHLAAVRIAAIGDATHEALRAQLAVRADFVPTRFVGESLAGELMARQEVAGKRFLLLRADIARPALPQMLQEAGAQVEEVVAYQTRVADRLADEVVEALRAGEVDWVTFTSASTVRNLVQLLGRERGLLEKVKVASIGPITSEAAREAGLTVTVEAKEANVHALARAVAEAT